MLNDIEKNDISFIPEEINALGKYIEKLFGALKPKCSFDDFVYTVSEYIDNIILDTRKKENLTCIAGNCNFSISEDEKYIIIIADIYFQNANKQWIKKTVKGKTTLTVFSKKEIETLREIQKNGMKIDIQPPEMK